MKVKIIISTIIAFLISSLVSPPDTLTALILGIESMLFCCVALLILARCKFVKSTSNSMHTLVCILVLMISVLFVQWPPWLQFQETLAEKVKWSPDFSSVSSSTGFRIGNLWFEYLSDSGGFWSKDIECVTCSLDTPKTSSYDGSTMVFTFSDSNSVEVNIKNGETIWIDKQHRVTFLGPVLNKEDILLLSNYRYDGELEISSPEELLAIVNKLKAEHADSMDPQEALRH